MVFARMAELTPARTRLSRLKPDACRGEDPTNIPSQIRDEIGQYIMSGIGRSPAVVNDFVEIQGPDGRDKHLVNQVAYGGTAGARAIYSARTYGSASPPLDRNARGLVTTYSSGQASFYASYMEPLADAEASAYHTYLVAAESAIGSVNQYRRAQQYYRNLQDLAAEERTKACGMARQALRRKQIPE